MSFTKNMGTHATKATKNLSNKYGQKLLDSAKNSTADAIKTASKRAIQKLAGATGDLIGNKTADKITNVSTELQSKRSPKEFHSQKEDEIERPKKGIYLQKKYSKLLMN